MPWTRRSTPSKWPTLPPRTTGLPLTVWVSPRGHARHDARIKVSLTPGKMDIDNVAVGGHQTPARDARRRACEQRLRSDRALDRTERGGARSISGHRSHRHGRTGRKAAEGLAPRLQRMLRGAALLAARPREHNAMAITAPPAETAWLLHHVLGFDAHGRGRHAGRCWRKPRARPRACSRRSTAPATGWAPRWRDGGVTVPAGLRRGLPRLSPQAGWIGIAADPTMAARACRRCWRWPRSSRSPRQHGVRPVPDADPGRHRAAGGARHAGPAGAPRAADDRRRAGPARCA